MFFYRFSCITVTRPRSLRDSAAVQKTDSEQAAWKDITPNPHLPPALASCSLSPEHWLSYGNGSMHTGSAS